MTAAPLWPGLLASPTTGARLAALQRPVLLRMESDDFMEDLAAVLRDDPGRVAALEATPRSYRARPPAADPAYQPPMGHLKLFQPVHGHFNLVAAALVCRVVGLPDKGVEAGADETVAFVLRRLDGVTELGWTGGGWTAAAQPSAVVDGEELLPMFAMTSHGRDRTRRVFVGLVPTSSTASSRSRSGSLVVAEPRATAAAPPDPRPTEIDVRVVRPLAALQAATAAADRSPLGRSARTEASQFLLLDLIDILVRHVPTLWAALQQGVRPAPTGLSAVYLLLNRTEVGAAPSRSWREALLEAYGQRERIWGDQDGAPTLDVDLSFSPMDPQVLDSALVAALPLQPAAPHEDVPEGLESPKLDPRPGVRYVVRCVYRRPRCGPRNRDLTSEPTVPFAIAPFFDPDAPARAVHIAMPLDTSVAGLRKAPRNVRIMVSRELQSQVQRVTDLKKTLDGELQDGEPLDLGLICSFSLPIITICALVVLMIFVIVLNLAFWWLPFFKICFSVPVRGKP